jgi:hypothetical protein
MPLTITEIALAGLILQELTTERVLQFRKIPKIRDSLNRTARRPGLTHEETKWLYAGRILFVTAVILAIDWEDDYSMVSLKRVRKQNELSPNSSTEVERHRLRRPASISHLVPYSKAMGFESAGLEFVPVRARREDPPGCEFDYG